MQDNEREVLTEMLLLMDKYNLYGKMAIPKKHDYENEVPELYRIAAETGGVFVNPGLSENFGLTLIEAAATGLPVVATKNGGPKEIVEKLKNGILVDVNDPKNISEAINKILDSKDDWQNFSNNGVNRINRFFSWDAHTSSYIEMIKEQISRNHLNPKTFIQTGRNLLQYKKLIFLDIDNTITGDAEKLKELNLFLKDLDNRIGVGIVTGRTIDSTVDFINETGFIRPDVIISSVGTEIYFKDGNNYEYSKNWETHISNSWKPDLIRRILWGLTNLEIQSPESQRKFKVSYSLTGANEKVMEVKNLLIENRIKTNLIYSHNSFIDLLPYRASKGRAIRYLSYCWNIPLENILTCGDSGNDEDMLTGELLGVVVANYSPELEKLKGRRRIYFAKTPYAEGVIEGINYYNFIAVDSVQPQ
jgi:sucrose-phosphate synthase